MTVLDDFAHLYEFPLDTFQSRACVALEAGHEVLVAAPTGAGKTIVGEFAVHLALAGGGKCFYTTPIKALSNQKFADLRRRYGSARVGLLTGDNTVNGEAPIVVMTTEVLRNMLYVGSTTLTGLRFVVLDEVHYLADRTRGAVWEEIIIHLPESVSVVALSATVSNVEEFGEWLETVRGDTTIVVEERRPVPLYQHVLVGRRLYNLFDDGDGGTVSHVNSELEAAVRRERRREPFDQRRGRGRPPSRRRRDIYASRPEVVAELSSSGLLPAIVFIFSRLGCEAAVDQCRYGHVRLTNAAERVEITRVVEERTAGLSDADLDVLGYQAWAESLSRGIAAHHAGLLPSFKECVEALFVRGLVKVVFATETLALGINMPARSVVLEKLTKWNGDVHADITPGEFTQLTGRAGRRGIDVEGHAVVQWRPEVDVADIAGLASTRTYPLRSSFRPSYNMAVNLVGQFGRARARTLLESSFAQFQADRAVVGLARQARKAEQRAAAAEADATCDLGDFAEYTRLRRQLSALEKSTNREQRRVDKESVVTSLAQLRIGDVIDVPRGKWAGRAVVVDPGTRSSRDDPRPVVITARRQARRLSVVDFASAVIPVAQIKVPVSFNPRNPQQRRTLAAQLRSRTRDIAVSAPPSRPDEVGEEIVQLRAAIRAHPCHACPEREKHTRAVALARSAEHDAAQVAERIEQRTNTIARDFDRVCGVLTELGHLVQDEVSADGRALGRLYNELDLLAAECLRLGVWEGLDAPALAACLAALVFESRSVDRAPVSPPEDAAVRAALREMGRIGRELEVLERGHGLRFLRDLDTGFSRAAWEWADGSELATVLLDLDVTPGDFVRSTRQLIDLCEQVAVAAGDSPVATTARKTVPRLRRGVVAETPPSLTDPVVE
jgi:ATP-dependent RNA helicase HelY